MTVFASLAARNTRLTYAEALPIANQLLELNRPYWEWVEIGGSIRREKQDGIKDIEIVGIPKIQQTQAALFAEVEQEPQPEDSLAYAFAQELIETGIYQHRLNDKGERHFGPRSQRVIYKGIAVDIFAILPPAQVGLKRLLHTGPAEFNRQVVTRRSQGGWLPDDCEFDKGGIYRRWVRPGERHLTTELLPTPTEEDVFRILGIDYLEPKDRQ